MKHFLCMGRARTWPGPGLARGCLKTHNLITVSPAQKTNCQPSRENLFGECAQNSFWPYPGANAGGLTSPLGNGTAAT